jgi:hypothetical protein
MRNLDFTSWETLLLSLFGIALVTLIGVGLRLVAMQAIQQRRERENRQINERLRTLIAAYKTLGGSFTGNLAVDPTHLADLRRHERAADPAGVARSEPSDAAGGAASIGAASSNAGAGSDRARRMRDAVEAALSDIILLGTEDQVRLAARAAAELVAGRPVHMHDLVVSLRDFIRSVLDLDPVPSSLAIPRQGPARPGAGGGARGKGEGGGRDEGRSGRGGGMGGAAMGAGMGAGVGGLVLDDDAHHDR